jgi:hypothetical protein
LTESLLLSRARRTSASSETAAKERKQPLSPSASLITRAWEAAIAARLRKDKEKMP